MNKTGRFILMDFKKWLNPNICSPTNISEGFTDGKIYEVYEVYFVNGKCFRILDSDNNDRVLHEYEVRALEVSLSEALIEMSKEEYLI